MADEEFHEAEENRHLIEKAFDDTDTAALVTPGYADPTDGYDKKRRGGRYGAEAVDIIEEYFQLDEGLIYRALRLANAFSEQEIQEATSHPKADGEPVSTRDLLILARVEDRALRKELLAQAITKAWRAADLVEAVDRAVGKEETEKPDGRGRPLVKPRNFDDVVRQQEQGTRSFVERAVNVWEKPEHLLLAKAADLAMDDYTEERAGKLKSHAELHTGEKAGSKAA